MNFFQSLRNSIYSPIFYKTIPQKTLWQAIRYFLLLILLTTIISLIFLFKTLYLETPKLIQNFAQETLNCFPKDLEIKITDGEAATNVEQPFFIENCGSAVRELTQTHSLVLIDTETPFSQSKFDEYNVAAWLTKDAVAFRSGTSQTRLYSLKEVDNFTLNKQIIEGVYNKFAPYLKFVGSVLLILSFLGIFMLSLFTLLQLLLTASLIWLLGKIFKQELNYSSAYKIGIFAASLGLILDTLVSFTSQYTNFYGFPFMFTAITLGVVVINVFLPAKKS